MLSSLYRDERAELERQFIEVGLACARDPASERMETSVRCFAEADAAEARWLALVQKGTRRSTGGLLYKLAWAGFNRSASVPAG